MPNKSKQLGKSGETAAANFLKKNGYHILETNYRTTRFEIDIIAQEKETLCFIEVKTRQSLSKGSPAESITRHKQHKIIMGAQTYLKTKALFDTKIRFDVIEVYIKDGQFKFNLIRHAFQTT